jgi:sulfite reductase beta subunit-like hemoprotein
MKFDPAMAKNEHVKQAKDGLDVWEDLQRYTKEGYAAITEDDFVRMRWFGIYQQKPNEGHFMWRIRISGGKLSPQQMRVIAQYTAKHARGFADVTTRQCIQLHWLTIESFEEGIRDIYFGAGLYTQFACGDTPRNVCSCPLHGLLKNEPVDITGLPQQLSDLFKDGGKEFSNLPRKFKTAIAACPLHCHQPQINDIGVFGVTKPDGRKGLGVMVGGGLSSTPHFAQSLRVFVPAEKVAEQIPQIFRYVAHIFRDADSLRYKRKRARLKFLVADQGWQWFRDELERLLGYQLEHDDSIVAPVGALHTDHVGIAQQKDGLYYVGIPIERGRVTAEQMLAVADLSEKFCEPGKAEIRLSQKQNIIIVNVPQANIKALSDGLAAAGIPPAAPLWRQNLVSCTGTQFCNLAVVETKQRAYDLLKYLEDEVELDSPIMVSVTGCPNSCSQYQIADIGLTGTKSTWEGQKVDAYDVCLGGALGEKADFVQEIVPKVPSPVVHKVIGAIVKNYKLHRVQFEEGDVETFRDFVARHDVPTLQGYAKIDDWAPPPPKAKPAPKPAAV